MSGPLYVTLASREKRTKFHKNATGLLGGKSIVREKLTEAVAEDTLAKKSLQRRLISVFSSCYNNNLKYIEL